MSQSTFSSFPGTDTFVYEINQLLRNAHLKYHNPDLPVVPHNKPLTHAIIDGRPEPVANVTVWKFSTNPDNYEELSAALEDWLCGENAEWVIKNCVSAPVCYCNYEFLRWSLDCVIQAKLAGKALTEFMLTRKIYE